jgi:phage gpG-like protein
VSEDSLEVVWTGMAELSDSLDAMVTAADKAARAATEAAATLLQSDIKMKLLAQSHDKGTKTPSEPGEPPAAISAKLAGSIEIDGPEQLTGFGNYIAAVGADGIVYSRIQELGGMTGRGHRTRLPARPYTLNTLEEDADAIREIASVYMAAALEPFSE